MRIIINVVLILTVLFGHAGIARAHFAQGTKLRTILIAPHEESLTAYVRAPLPLVFSDVVTSAQASSQALDTPFLYFEETGAGGRYRLSMEAIAADESAFRERLERALSWSQNGREIAARIVAMRVHPRMPADSFDSREAAEAAIAGASSGIDPVFGEAYVDFAVSLSPPDAAGPVAVRSAYPPLPIPDGVTIDNHIIDSRGDVPVSYTRPGQLEQPAVIDTSLWRTVGEFVWQGVLHIVEGLDHVFLVICLALGIGARGRLLWIVTAFTLGHSVTLVATFLGATPSWPWFIPAVEAAIAATVLYAAVAALMGRMDSILLIAGVGLLHGLGFSFVLGDLLGRDAPNLVPALAAFNIGIEIGQLMIIAATLLAVAFATRLSASLTPVLRAATLAGIAVVSAWWVVERSATLVA
ncbi:HupE/UreJ family protein [Chelativorans salis]|uniref:HupE/UreJ family protein n=1 Tax=Chelativorans salis TaxID=2978478 RepID=A0ABT2LIL3_9HYPH|nr:HupE/UreJ family protein [Chelativorans sp. EGI FJ00035]MCT7374071.1 HupE/UreJ family protein [Chelativorans sp. EGI FJ00035]